MRPGRHSPPAEAFPAGEGRQLFGAHPERYHRARPPYPPLVVALLRERCGLGAGTRALEVGAGTGRATGPLLDAGASVVAVEPDPALAAYLRRALAGRPLEVVAAPLEEAALPAGAFDLAAAASSFHWVDQRRGLARIHAALRPGGWWAMWTTVYGNPGGADPFHEATRGLLDGIAPSPSQGERGRPMFALDRERRLADLEAAGFGGVTFEEVRWTHAFDAAATRALYATFGPITRLPAGRREPLLDAIAAVVDARFGGRVERPLVTPVLTAHRP